MKKSALNFIRIFPLVLALTNIASAAPKTNYGGTGIPPGSQMGFGVILGEPTGVTIQRRLRSNTALNAGLAYSFNKWVEFYVDHIWKSSEFLGGKLGSNPQLNGYIGFGGFFGFNQNSPPNDKAAMGVRVPLGGEYSLTEAPISLFFELVPAVQLIGGTDILIQGGVGARYFF